jgi:formiminotetrahydrofolate cyclodeaminase
MSELELLQQQQKLITDLKNASMLNKGAIGEKIMEIQFRLNVINARKGVTNGE